MKDFTPFINTENRRMCRITMIDFNFPYKIDIRLYSDYKTSLGEKWFMTTSFKAEYKKISDWCEENLTSEYILWIDIPRFSNAADAALFKLTWC